MKKLSESTKIVCTIGPASEKRKTLENMIKAGMDIVRLNFSHGNHEWHQQAIINLRLAVHHTKGNVAIMADLQGPRIRVNDLRVTDKKKKEIEFIEGDKVILKEKDTKKALPGYLEKQVRIDSKNVLKYLKKGDRVFLDAGTVELVAVRRRYKGGWEMVVKNDGIIALRKGINLPSLSKYIPSFTKKDKKDLEFALRQGVDFIALSFVKEAKDIVKVRKIIDRRLNKKERRPLLVAKLETISSMHNLKDILKVVDVVMVARGDLGVEADPARVPIYQKLILRNCFKQGIPAIVATNMLESMTELPRPTRAELTDVANAVIDRADTVMLSGETANGKYPLRSVEMMTRIISATERSPYDDINRIKELEDRRKGRMNTHESMTAQAVYSLVAETKPDSIIIENVPEEFVTNLSSLRPPAPIRYLEKDPAFSRILAMYWGVTVIKTRRALNEITSKSKHYIFVKGKYKKNEWDLQVKIINKD